MGNDTHASRVWLAYCYYSDHGQDNAALNEAAARYNVRPLDILDERDSLKED